MDHNCQRLRMTALAVRSCTMLTEADPRHKGRMAGKRRVEVVPNQDKGMAGNLEEAEDYWVERVEA
jgi:hypothetical protein